MAELFLSPPPEHGLTISTELSDDDLMRAAGLGHQSAFEALVSRHQRLVLGLALRFLGDAALAHDVAQEVFLHLWETREGYAPRGRFRSYLVSAALYRCNTHRRRILGHRVKLESLPPPEPTNQDGAVPEGLQRLVERERQRAVRAKLLLVPERFREVLVLRFGHGMSLDEVAGVTGLPLGTVKSHLFRGLKRLQELLGAEP